MANRKVESLGRQPSGLICSGGNEWALPKALRRIGGGMVPL